MSVREDEERPSMNDRRASSQPDGGGSEAPKPAEEGAGTLEEEREKAAMYMANWQRSAADFANYKRRVEQEREEWARLSNASLVMNVLPLFDDLERALDNADASIAGLTWFEGIRLIQRKFKQFLEGNGVEEIKADGEDFDPNVHEAVMFGEGPEGKVIGVIQKGYKLGNRVLRPTMVVVGQGGKQETTS
jgi:molecular chaperone GrpE